MVKAASRMEFHGILDQIQVSEDTFKALRSSHRLQSPATNNPVLENGFGE